MCPVLHTLLSICGTLRLAHAPMTAQLLLQRSWNARAGCAPAETLANIHGSLADGGFLMLYETTAAFTTCLWGLDERTWNFTDKREFGLWIAKPRWDRLWADAGFVQVIAHW